MTRTTLRDMAPWTVLVMIVITAALVLASSSAVAAPVYVYKGNGCDGLARIPQFEAFLGRRVDGVVDFIAADSWASFDSDGQWTLGCWKGNGRGLALSVPLTVQGTSLTDVAAGKQDSHFAQLVSTAVASGFGAMDIRLGWEMNGGWYPWAAASDPAGYIAAYRHVVGVIRAVPGFTGRLIWNPTIGWQQVTLDVIWPGADVVDVIGYDIYSEGWKPEDTAEPGLWNDLLTESWGVQGTAAFWSGIPIVIGEWGVGTRADGHGAPGPNGDDPVFVAGMAAWMATRQTGPNRILWANYWDYNASDFQAQLSDGSRPKAAAAFLAAFGTPKPVIGASAPMLGNTGTYTDGTPFDGEILTFGTTGAGGLVGWCGGQAKAWRLNLNLPEKRQITGFNPDTGAKQTWGVDDGISMAGYRPFGTFSWAFVPPAQ